MRIDLIYQLKVKVKVCFYIYFEFIVDSEQL